MAYKPSASIQHLIHALKAARVAKGVRQRVLAEQLGIPQSHLSRIETGQVNITLANFSELARLLDLEVMLVPRQDRAAVHGLLQSASSSPEHDTQQPAYTIDDEGDVDA